MLQSNDDTITALATSATPSAVGIIRVSGIRCKDVLKTCFKSSLDPIQNPRKLITGHLIDNKSNAVLDHCLAVYMPAPKTFTGEDIVEFQIHGSPVLAKQILNVLYKLGIRPANPGEFSERAFINNKIDLTQAEAIASIISSSSEAELKISEEQLAGKLTNVINKIGEPLRDILAEMEANIDFPEEDVEAENINIIKNKLNASLSELKNLIATYNYGSVIKDGLKVLIFGRPNVGKSSLLNYFLRSERAIVTSISGTTRDLIEETANINGFKFVFCDTAGITESNDQVEKIGIQRAKDKIKWADLVLLTLSVENLDELKFWETELSEVKQPIWLVINKTDLKNNTSPLKISTIWNSPVFQISVLKNIGLNTLEESLIKHIQEKEVTSSVTLTNERHRNCLENAQKSLINTIDAISNNMPIEIISSELRIGLNSLEEIIGRTYTEDILGRIFAKFCIGK
jgi:tRNA modification GTPase